MMSPSLHIQIETVICNYITISIDQRNGNYGINRNGTLIS